jgi:hypothetical protein
MGSANTETAAAVLVRALRGWRWRGDRQVAKQRKAATPREPSMPGVGNARGLSAAIVLVEPSLSFGDAADTRRKSRPVLTRESARGGWACRELGGIDVAPASDAVDVLALCFRGPARAFADQLLALTFGETLG